MFPLCFIPAPFYLRVCSFPLTNLDLQVKYRLQAEVAEQADALRSGRSSLHGSVGSTPTFGTQNRHPNRWCFCLTVSYC